MQTKFAELSLLAEDRHKTPFGFIDTVVVSKSTLEISKSVSKWVGNHDENLLLFY